MDSAWEFSDYREAPSPAISTLYADIVLGRRVQWDAENRLVSIVQASGTTGFVYDGTGHRVEETLNGTLIKQWVWCGSQPCEERDGSGNVTKRFYAQGEQIGGVPYYFTRDHLGSVREMTDGTGAIRAQYDYDPYGRVTKISGDLTADFGFTGDYYHAATGLSLTMFRAYDPNLGRWLNADPAGLAGGLNLYAYVGNRPIDRIDPTGLSMDGTSSPYSAATLIPKSARSYGPDPEGTAVLFKVYEGAGAALVLTLAPEAVAVYGPEITAAANTAGTSALRIALNPAVQNIATIGVLGTTAAEGPLSGELEGLGEQLEPAAEILEELGSSDLANFRSPDIGGDFSVFSRGGSSFEQVTRGADQTCPLF